ncbi:hypothetical protein KY285_015061 [Solanum tuberosum]|nr:hypothetical protein KY289_015847 [Solanum tuberosum]KAH0719030.1 hypothetical protein KY285_015061 [Solanum tuberosum]
MPYNIDIKQSKLAFQPIIGGNKGDVVVVPWKFDQEECRKALCRMVIIDELPFRFVEKEGFKQFMKVAQPCFHIPSRTTVTRDCFDLFDEEKHKLMAVFKETQQRVSLTTDTWTSIQRINYMVITAHWIDKNWTLHKRIINFCPISSHRGEDLGKSIIDNASSNSVAITELSKQLTKWGTNLMGGSHLHIRQAVRYIRQSPARWKKFQECCEDENLAKTSLCLDVPTRWNSTYMMLNRVIEYEGAIVEYADRDIGLALHLKFVDIVDKNSTSTLLSSDWEGVKRITKFLEMFFNLTLKISGSRYVTSNLHFLEICQVGVYLNQLISNEDHVLAKMAENMMEKFDKYWGDTEKMNKMVFIPCVLDPRHKFSTLGFALKKMFGEKGAAVEIGVRTSVGGLGNFFEELQKHTSQRGGASSKSELVKYLDEEIEVGKSDFDVLLWWKVNSPRFPFLSEMARDVLAIPVSSVASECAFSTGGRILDSFRSSLTPKLVQALVCLQDWLRSEPQPISIEEDLDFLEQLEEDFIMPRLHGSNARSPVWNHYEKLEEKEDGSWIVKCVHCSRVTYHHSHKTGTASLRKHVKRCLENMNQNRQLLRIDG